MKTHKKKLAIISLVVVVLLAAGGYFGWQQFSPEDNQDQTNQAQQQTNQESQEQLSLEDKFIQAYYDADLPNLKELAPPPEITGDEAADEHIRQVAEERGYRLQKVVDGEVKDLQGVQVQPPVVEAWQQMQEAARKQGVYLALISGYRTVENQQEIFTQQLQDQALKGRGQSFTATEIANGKADKILNKILNEYSIPGYSKHHTGYAIDITDSTLDKPFAGFADSAGYKWISKNDYANAREFGFLPSYPENGPKQGPQPEPWEYVWVGADNSEQISVNR